MVLSCFVTCKWVLADASRQQALANDCQDAREKSSSLVGEADNLAITVTIIACLSLCGSSPQFLHCCLSIYLFILRLFFVWRIMNNIWKTIENEHSDVPLELLLLLCNWVLAFKAHGFLQIWLISGKTACSSTSHEARKGQTSCPLTEGGQIAFVDLIISFYQISGSKTNEARTSQFASILPGYYALIWSRTQQIRAATLPRTFLASIIRSCLHSYPASKFFWCASKS